MFFLNEYLIAASLSILAFILSFAASLFYKISIISALLRSTIIAFIFMFAGLFFGKIIKNLIVEAFMSDDEQKESEAEGDKKPDETASDSV
jgi:Zn-dependent protease with chaperone function